MNRITLGLLLVLSSAVCGEQPRFRVTHGPKFEITSPPGKGQDGGTASPGRMVPPAPSLPEQCVKIGGVDYDLEPMLAEYRRAWTWPGMTEASLREHLREHQVDPTGLTYDQCQKVHSVIHEREAATLRTSRMVQQAPVAQPSTLNSVRSACPGGVCPAPRWSSQPQRRGLFGWRR